jgi:putative ABC transport system permease protein
VYQGIEGFATNSCFMGAGRTGEAFGGFQRGRYWNIQSRDVEILRRSIPEIDVLSPILFGGRSENNVMWGDTHGTFNIRGLHSNFQYIENQFLTQGRFINEIDIMQRRKVCVIGTNVAEELFPEGIDPIGQHIRVNGIYYQVVGVALGVSNMNINGRTSNVISIPFTTLQQVNNLGTTVHMLGATARSGHRVSTIETQMREILKANNNISPTDRQAIWGFNMEEQFSMFNNLFLGIIIIIWVVGSGTLIAGIVGVSNIMLVTIKERTKEIAIRRALGAKPRQIISQIMSESLVLTSIAGLLGLCFGVLILYLAETHWLTDMDNMFFAAPYVSFSTAIASTVILIICGLIAGIIPTRRALRIKAIDAIREE